MKKNMVRFLQGIVAIILLGSGMNMGVVVAEEADASSEVKVQASADSGLTPRKKSVVRAQRPSQQGLIPKSVNAENRDEPVTALPSLVAPPPVKETPPRIDTTYLVAAAPPAPTVAIQDDSSNAFVYSELDRLSAEIAKLKKDTKKPDTKKAWSTPKINGRLFLDTYAIDQDAKSNDQYGDMQNKAGIREMQFSITGNGFDSFDYKLELSLAPDGGRVNLVDNWIGVKHVPLLGYVRAGHYKPETGLAYPASALHTTTTEFTGPSSSFGLGRRFGVSSANLFARDRIRFFMGVFQEGATNTNRYIHDDDQGQVVNFRLSAAPYYEQEGRYVFHVGGHYSYVSPRNATTSIGTNVGSIGWLQSTVSSGNFANNHNHRGGLELALQTGPFAIQSEVYFTKYVEHMGAPDRTAKGAYVELKYFLTGEHRTYNLKSGSFGAAKVKRNFHPHKYGDHNLIDGFGAWQAVVQWSYLDLIDWRAGNFAGARRGGMQHDLTFAMNWFWTPNIRWIFEYVHSQQNVGADRFHCDEDIFGTSLRVHF